MTGTVASVGIFKEKKQPRTDLERARAMAGRGLEGDMHCDDAERPISLMGVETKIKIRDEGIEGLCTARFSENITTAGIALHRCAAGTEIAVGTAILEITRIGKECFRECRMPDRSKCPLRAECLFARTVSGGCIAPGDAIRIRTAK